MFAWDAYEAPGVDSNFICHHLNVNPSITLKRQPPRQLANTVVVKKKSEKSRVCVGFTNLNKASPKDPFPMPRIDQLVDAMVGHPWMSFLDAFQ